VNYCEQVLLKVVVGACVGFELFAAVALEGLECIKEVVLHEILVEDADDAFLLLADCVEGEVGRHCLSGVDWRQLGGGACL
jgi:hypothetical protein